MSLTMTLMFYPPEGEAFAPHAFDRYLDRTIYLRIGVDGPAAPARVVSVAVTDHGRAAQLTVEASTILVDLAASGELTDA